MSFELPGIPFPLDSNHTPYIASPDDAGKYTAAASQWFKKETSPGSGVYWWAPVSVADPLPTTAKDGDIVSMGAKADAAVVDPTLSASEIALLKGIIKQLQGTGTGAVPTTLTGSNFEQTIGSAIPAKAALMGISDGTNIKALEGKIEKILLASAARTAYTSTPIQTNINAKGVLVVLNITVASGTGGLKLLFNGQVNGLNVNIAGPASPSTAIVATGRYGFIIYPGIGAAPSSSPNNVIATFSTVIPAKWFIDISHGDATSYTYDISYQYLV